VHGFLRVVATTVDFDLDNIQLQAGAPAPQKVAAPAVVMAPSDLGEL
jgi:hypothetical protein